MIPGWIAILLPTPLKTSGLYGGISCSQRVGQSNMNGVNAFARDFYNASGVQIKSMYHLK